LRSKNSPGRVRGIIRSELLRGKKV
jgi:hypothetical protein